MIAKVAVDLFCGTGGFSHGWLEAGGHIAVAVDCWDVALENHQHNHPNVAVLNLELGGSIKETAFILRQYLDSMGFDEYHFHLHGSPPCQSLSNASWNKSKEEGMILVNWFLELKDYMKPDSWSMENVLPVGKFLDRLGVPYLKVDSANFGVPQRRRRVFAGEGWELVESHSKQNWVSVVEKIPYLADHDFEAAPSMRTRWKNLSINGQFPTITGASQIQIRIVSRRISKKMSIVRGVDAQFYYPFEPAHTISQVVHVIESGQSKRSMTVQEAAIIQGWSDLKFKDGLKMRDKRLMVGNMVCPPIAKAICEGIQ